MDQAEINNWKIIFERMEASGDTESWFYLSASHCGWTTGPNAKSLGIDVGVGLINIYEMLAGLVVDFLMLGFRTGLVWAKKNEGYRIGPFRHLSSNTVTSP